MLTAIRPICLSVWVRALRELGVSELIDSSSTLGWWWMSETGTLLG